MTDLSNPWPSWGEQGELPPNGFFYEGGDQVNEKHLDSLWNTQDNAYQSLIDGITSRVEDIQGNIRLDTGLIVSQSNGLETTVTASTAGAYVNGQQTGSTSQRTLTHSTNGDSVDRTDSIWVDIDGQVGKTEDTTTVAANRFKIAEVVVTPTDTIDSISNVAPRITSVFASGSEPVDTDSGDVWLDTSSNRLKGKQSGAFQTLVTEQDSLSITAGSGLSGGGSINVFNGTTSLSLTNDSVTVTAGSNLSGGGTVALGESITLDVNSTNLDADTVDGFEAAELGLDIEDNGDTTVSNSVGLNFTDNFAITDGGDNTASVTLQQGSGSGLDADNIRGASPATVATSGSHNDLSNIGSSDHHSRYSDSEASNAAPVQSVNGSTGDVTVEGVPSGVISMWSGSTSNVPSGWTLCDGTDGTPDLQDRFVVGAGGTYNVDDTGGSNSVTLDVSEMPSHTHNASYDAEGGGGGDRNAADRIGLDDAGPVNVDVEPTGGDQAHENRPPYYALAYIQKL